MRKALALVTALVFAAPALADTTIKGPVTFVGNTGISVSGSKVSLTDVLLSNGQINAARTMSGSGNTTINANQITLTSFDTLALTGAASFLNTLYVEDIIGSALIQGGRQAIVGKAWLTVPTSASNANRNYVGILGWGIGAASDNGGAGTEAGAVFGGNFVGQSGVAANYLLEVAGYEVNYSNASTTTKYVFGGSIVAGPLHSQHATLREAILEFGAQTGAIGMRNGILYTTDNGAQPISSDGCLICTNGLSSITTGFSIGGSTPITGNSFEAQNFHVTGAGALAASNIQTAVIYSVAGTNLPTCDGAHEGVRASVSDANSVAFHAAYVGSSTNHVSVYCNSATWYVQ